MLGGNIWGYLKVYIGLPSGKQTWQWKIHEHRTGIDDHRWCLKIKASIYRGSIAAVDYRRVYQYMDVSENGMYPEVVKFLMGITWLINGFWGSNFQTNLYPQYARFTDNSRLASAFTSSSRPRQYVLVADTQNPGEPFKHIQISLIRQLKNSWIMIFPANLVYMCIYI
jgi:hypothetical protein